MTKTRATHSSSRLTATVLKAMGLFSGLQMVGIICAVVKMKLVAIWLHASGVGLFSIYQSVVDTIATLSDMGLRQSAVRDVASHRTLSSRLNYIAFVVRRWSAFAGLLGAVIIMGGAPLLSRWLFHTWSAVWGFMLLGLAMLLNSLTGGEQAILQGSGKLKALARGNLWGTLAGLLASIPLFNLLGEKSVALSIVVYALAMYLTTRHYRLRTPAPSPAIGLRAVWECGRGFARLGLYMAFAAFVTNMAHTLFVALLNTYAGTEQVGYVQAGDTIIVRYIGLVFTAIGMEFYPRMAAAARHRCAMQTYVNHEISLLLLILTPLLLLFILLRCPVVQLLYTRDFIVIIPFITWGALSSIPKAVSWCMAFTIISKGDGRTYIITEALDALISVPLCYFAYVLHGLPGLGIAYIAWYLIYTLITGYVYHYRYRMSLSRPTLLVATLSLAVSIAGVFAVEHLPAAAYWPLLLGAAACFIPPMRRLLRR